MRTKLVLIFVIIKVIPLVLLTILAWWQANILGNELSRRTQELTAQANAALQATGAIAVDDSVAALNNLAIEQIERTSTDMARRVADFLYDRDADILFLAALEPNEAVYRRFVETKTRSLVKQREWALSEDQTYWEPREPPRFGEYSPSSNPENDTNYHNRPRELWETEERPLYLEVSYVDLAGNEIIKIATSDQMDSRRKNVSNRLNTYVKAETYFSELGSLKPGEIYVSDVIGAYVGSHLIGMYNPENAASRGLEWRPEEEAYAGEENPLGKRFKGIVRWASPVTRNGRITGYVTLALDHDHIMEFTDRVTPMSERYTELPSAFEGNYAFIWDYKCRSICHPRHPSIVGFNPETGEPEIPWLETSVYQAWRASGLPYTEFIKDVPAFADQSRDKKPAPELTAAGLVGLDGRYLNNAPQCTGWFDLTAEGGSGSFLILWSGIWKPNTAATIPYYTGHYGQSKRGFGFVAIGAGLEDFQRPALETKAVLDKVIAEADRDLGQAAADALGAISRNLLSTTVKLVISAGFMILLVVLIAVWLASILTGSITNLINGISRFRAGERQFRFNPKSKDEFGTLAASFDEMADSLVAADREPLTIINMDYNVIYANKASLVTIGKETLDEVIGKSYSKVSVYPDDPRYNPIAALHENREAEIFYRPETKEYIKGRATYLRDKQDKVIGYIVTTSNITEMVNQQKELERAVDAAKLANEHKGSFLARMSHEIRTPMNAIIGMTNIVKKQLVERKADQKEMLNNISQIETSSQHMLGLLNDILDISKIEAGKIELTQEPVDLLKLGQSVVTIIKPRCDEKNINFEIDFDIPGNPFYLSDSLRLRQVFINLLGNAVKFTPELGRIIFTMALKENRDDKALIECSVRDTGIGISEDAQKSLFRPFEQANNQIAKKYGGTGLGLAISQSIVQLFGGDITIQSREGEGSCFSFELWMLKAEKSEEAEVAVENVAGMLRGKRALLVDDVEINRLIASSLMEDTGLAMDEADDGLSALKIFQEKPEHTYDIIYLDIQMPNMNGYDAASAIRALDRGDAKTVPIVAMTANAFKEDVTRALESGMNAHLSKPIEPDKMMELTFKLLGVGRGETGKKI
jgi:signal transduction histidine kinase/CheY-like chemotaxis protein/HAMP domain-containing protein